MKAADMNTSLERLYGNALEELRPRLTQFKGLSQLHSIYVPESYVTADVRLMIVGQETMGWSDEKFDSWNARARMELYRSFNLAETYSRRGSPFWRASYQLHKSLNPLGPERSFLWSNLLKMDQNYGKPEEAVAKILCEISLLRDEILITKPDVVVFFTGPNYDHHIERLFPAVQGLSSLSKSNLWAVLQHLGLPKLTFRTYHPRSLQMQKQWVVLKQIEDKCRASPMSRNSEK